MNWFYALNGQQAGPVDDTELERLVQVGTIAPSTLVWSSGMAQWLPYSEARLAVPPRAATASAAATSTSLTAAAAPTAAQVQCSQCGRVLPADEIVRVDGLNVCEACKPTLQRTREGVPAYNAVPLVVVYAGFWIRVGAACLDGIILIPFGLVVGLGAYFLLPNLYAPVNYQGVTDYAAIWRETIPYSVGTYILLGCYSAFCLSRFGGTPGKCICNLRVVHGLTGQKVTFARGLGRFAAKIVPRAVPLLGLLYALADALFIVFDEQNRALHDMICDTRVVDEAP